MDELRKLEDKINMMTNTINGLKQKIQDLELENSRFKFQLQEAKKKVDGLIEKVDSLLL